MKTKILEIFSKYSHFFNAIVISILITFASTFFHDYFGLLNISLLHLIPIIVVAIHGDIKATMITTFLIIILVNFLYVPPLYSLSVYNTIHIWSFLIFGLVGYIIAYQSKQIYIQAKENEMREVLLNIISHDLKTPLSSIHGSVNLLLSDDNLSYETKNNLLHEINDASNRMKRLITSFLDNARLKSSNIQLKYNWCDFDDIVGVALDDFNRIQCEKYLDVRIDNLVLFWGDNELLIRLISNLLDNAFKYSINNKKIILSIKEEDDNISITLFNESHPIEAQKLDNIFDKFYRIEDTNDISGSGIGLAICKSIATVHKGTIDAKNVDNGILISVKLPIFKRTQVL